MTNYLIFESRDPFESAEVPHHWELAERLAQDGATVTFFLVQNGVLAARRSLAARGVARLREVGVRVLADAFSLRERAIRTSGLAPGVAVAELDEAVEALISGCRTFWL